MMVEVDEAGGGIEGGSGGAEGGGGTEGGGKFFRLALGFCVRGGLLILYLGYYSYRLT
jgi:hypothetical protein